MTQPEITLAPTGATATHRRNPATDQEHALGTPESEARFDEMKRYVGFGPQDEVWLATLREAAAAGLERLLDGFYETIARHPDASRVFVETDGDPARLRITLADWVRTCLLGPYDGDYATRRKAIGHAHVRHQLPQRYMHLAMNLVRRWFTKLSFEVHADDPDALQGTINAVDRLLDIELALMLGTYRDDLLSRMQRQERLATIGELAAGIHHELKNPLAAVDAALFALGDRRALRADPASRRLLDRARANADRASEIITDLLSFARLRNPATTPVSVEDIVRAALDRVTIPAACRLVEDLDPALPLVRVDAAQIEQVLVNILENAFDSGPTSVRVSTRLSGDAVDVEVSDDGMGIPSDQIERVFEPLFSTKPEGVGLGLSLSRNLVHANRGAVRLLSELGQGTAVTVSLPLG